MSRLVLVLPILLAGCAADGPTSEGCASSRECGAGQVCIDRRCAPVPDASVGCGVACECATDGECRARVPACVDAVCVEGSCFFRELDERCAGGRCEIGLGCVGGEGDGGAPDAGVAVDGSADGDAGPTADGDAGPTADGDAGPTADGGAPASDGGGSPDASTRRPIGSACAEDGQCEGLDERAGMCATSFADQALPGGYCTVACNGLTMNTCGEGAICVREILTTGRCMARCRSDSECRTAEGYRCRLFGGSSTRVCAPGRIFDTSL